MWQHVRTRSKISQNAGNLWPFCENPVCPNPVWKPVTVEKVLLGILSTKAIIESQGFSH